MQAVRTSNNSVGITIASPKGPVYQQHRRVSRNTPSRCSESGAEEEEEEEEEVVTAGDTRTLVGGPRDSNTMNMLSENEGSECD